MGGSFFFWFGGVPEPVVLYYCSAYGWYNCTIPPPVRFFKNTCTSFSVDRVKILTLKTTNILT